MPSLHSDPRYYGCTRALPYFIITALMIVLIALGCSASYVHVLTSSPLRETKDVLFTGNDRVSGGVVFAYTLLLPLLSTILYALELTAFYLPNLGLHPIWALISPLLSCMVWTAQTSFWAYCYVTEGRYCPERPLSILYEGGEPMMRLVCGAAVVLVMVGEIVLAGIAVYRFVRGRETKWRSERVGMRGFGYGKGEEAETRDVVRYT